MAELEREQADRISDVEVSMTERFTSLFEHMQEGVALHEVICDAEGRPIDYRILDVNAMYVQHTGLQRADAAGKLASELYGTGSPPYLQEFCSVGMGAPAYRFETYFAPLDRHFSISVAPLGPKAFATIFSDISLQKKQANALERIRLHQRALLDNQPHLTWLKDLEGRFLAVNQAFATACGQPSPEAVVGKTDFEVWQRGLAEVYRADDEAVIASGTQKAVEEEIVGVDGTGRWFETYKSPVFDPDGSIVGTTGVSRDISTRKRAELARLQSERKFEQVFELAPDPIAVTTMGGEMLYVNRAFCKATGFSRDEMMGRRTLDLGVWEDPLARVRAMAQLQHEGHFESVEMTLVSKSGEKRHMEMSGALIELDGGTVMITAARDITEHRLAEQQAKLAADTLAQYFKLSLDLLCIANREGRFVRLNPAWADVLGIPISELEGKQFLDLVHPEDIESTLTVMRQLAEGNNVIDFQNRFRHASGTWRWIEWRSVPDGHGLVYAVARDISRRREDEAALRAAERAAAASREQLLSVSELAHIGHFIIDFANSEVQWTPEFYRIVGIDPGSCVPTLDAGRATIHPDDLVAIEGAVEAAAKHQAATRLYNRVVRPNGEVRYCLSIIESHRIAPCRAGAAQA